MVKRRTGAIILACWIIGWALLTAGIAALTTPWAWAISGGLFAMVAGGIRPLALAAWIGIGAVAALDDKEP